MSESEEEVYVRVLRDLFSDVPKGHPGAWRVEVDGKAMGHVSQLRLVLEIPGIRREVQYGMVNSEGGSYPGLFYTEGGGGGTCAVTYAIIDGQLYIAVVEQQRINMWSGIALCMPGGYQAHDKTVPENAATEFAEEISNRDCVILKTFRLNGDPGNFNRGLHATLNAGDGISFVAFEVNPRYLVDNGSVHRFVDGITTVDPGTEQVRDVVFVHWTRAALISDLLMNAGVARLIAHLHLNRGLGSS